MYSMIYFVSGLVVGMALMWVIKRKPQAPTTPPASQAPLLVKEGSGGIEAVNQKRQQEKQAAKEKILELVGKQETVSNDDVQKLLNVSDATATNYLQELEDEGRLQQDGTDGRYVRYRVKVNG